MWDTWLEKYQGTMQKTWHGNVGLAVWDSAGEGRLRLLQGAQIGEGIALLGYELSKTTAAGAVSVTLYWTTDSEVLQDYTVFTHLVDGQGRIRGQKDNQPVGGSRPTSTWRTDRIVRDEYTIPLGDVLAGEYWIEVGMYDVATGERLLAVGEGAIPDGRIRLPRPIRVPAGAS